MDTYQIRNSVERQFLLKAGVPTMGCFGASKTYRISNASRPSLEDDISQNDLINSSFKLNNEHLFITNPYILNKQNAYRTSIFTKNAHIDCKSCHSKIEKKEMFNIKENFCRLLRCNSHYFERDKNKYNISNYNIHAENHIADFNTSNKSISLCIQRDLICVPHCHLNADHKCEKDSYNYSNIIFYEKMKVSSRSSKLTNKNHYEYDSIYSNITKYLKKIRAATFHTFLANHVKLKHSNVGKIVTILYYLFLISSLFRSCAGNKHEGNLMLQIFQFF